MTDTEVIDPEWPEETKTLARELDAVGDEWQQILTRRKDLSPRREALIVALDKLDVRHAVIAKLASTSVAAVEQVLHTVKKRETAR